MHENVMVHLAKCLLQENGSYSAAAAQALKIYGPSSQVYEVFTKQSSGTEDLGADPDFRYSAGRPFLKLVSPKSLFGKINAVSGFRDVPGNTPVLVQNTRPVASWTGEGLAVYASKQAFDAEQLDRLKLSTLLVTTDRLVRGQGEEFIKALRNDMVDSIAILESVSFIDPSFSGVADVSPASVTYGLSPITGTDNPRDDIETLVDNFQGDLETAVLVMHPRDAVVAGGYFSDLVGARGGECAGIPVVTSTSVPADSNGRQITLLDPAGIMVLDEGVDFRVSQSASIKISEEEGFYNLFQNGLTGMIGTRYLNWKVTRPGSVLTMQHSW